MPQVYNRISDDSVKKATGKYWSEWFTILKKEGADEMSHKEIARMLWDKKYIKSGWWCQMVTVGYEYAHKKRVVGETLSAGFEIGASKTLHVSAQRAWDFIMSSKGKAIWLAGGRMEIRTQKKGERIRMTYQNNRLKNPSVLQIYVEPRKSVKGMCLYFHQEKLSSAAERNIMRSHWKKVLEEISNELSEK